MYICIKPVFKNFNLISSLFFKSKKNDEEVSTISSLAPKILKKEEDIEKIQPYLNKLKDSINVKRVSIMVLKGSYMKYLN
ncbi:hypothetical protein C4S76_00250 [Apibacter adventoris]|nr:hypothetical protein C4S76_00250 [Apibacter adventoris]